MKYIAPLVLAVLLTGCESQQSQASHMAYRYTNNCYDDTIVTNMTQEGDVKIMTITCRVKQKTK